MKILYNLLLLGASCTVFCCNGSIKSSSDRKILKEDSIKRPKNVSKQAILVNLGFDDLPVFMWVEYSGKFIYRSKVYPHIYGFRYYDTQGKLTDTQYYENMEIRNGHKEFGNVFSKILPFPGDATIQVCHNKDSLLFFHVLESDELKSKYKGIEYVRLPAIYLDNIHGNGFMSAEEVRFNKRNEKDLYIITFLGDDVFEISFKLCASCKVEPTKISFLNEHEGRIYFVESDCYLELVNIEDIKKLQSLNR